MSDAEVIERAEALGMVMTESDTSEIKTSDEEAAGAKNQDNWFWEDETENTDTDTDEALEDVSDTEGQGTAEQDETEIYTLVVKSGQVCRTICENLQTSNVIDDAEAFRKYLGSVGFASSISTGTYEIPYGLSYEEIYLILKDGPLEKKEETNQ